MRAFRLTMAVVLMAVTGCSGGSLTSQAGGSSRPAFETVLDRVHDDGTIDKDTALQAFALAFGPLPGVSRPQGSSEEILSGSGPLRWVLGHFSELTSAQQKAVMGAIGKASSRALRQADGPVLMASTASTEQTHYENLVNEAWVYYAGKYPSLPVPDGPHPVTLNSQNLYDANAYTFPVDAKNGLTGPYAACLIYFNPRIRTATIAKQREAAFHEVFHCFEARMVTNLSDYYRLSGNGKGPGAWLVEGGAMWAGDEGAKVAPIGAKWWNVYFAHPAKPLFKRTYDANGFFGHVQKTLGDVGYVYASFPKAFEAISGGNVAAFNAFVGKPDQFFPTWPTGLLRQESLGSDWDTTGPGITGAVKPGTVAVVGGASPSGNVPAFANDDRQLNVSAEVMLVSTGLYSRLREIKGSFDSRLPSDIYCTRSGGCTCPDGTSLAGTKFKQLDPGAYYLALGGGGGSNSWSIAGYSLADFCKQPPADKCLVGTWKLVSPPAIPGRVNFNKIDEVFTVSGNGTMTLDVNIGASETASGFTVTVNLTGRGTIQAVTVNGVIQPKSSDFSGLQVAASLDGHPFPNIPLSQLFPGIESELTPVAYTCSGNSLFLYSISGQQQWGFSRS